MVKLPSMSTVEIAIKKVRKLSPRQARALLGWLDKHQAGGNSSTGSRRAPRQLGLARRKQAFKEWQESVRGKTNWEPPRMPNDLVKPFRL
jgi:hypothetical protein